MKNKTIEETFCMSFYSDSEECKFFNEQLETANRNPLIVGPLYISHTVVVGCHEDEDTGITRFTFMKSGGLW